LSLRWLVREARDFHRFTEAAAKNRGEALQVASIENLIGDSPPLAETGSAGNGRPLTTKSLYLEIADAARLLPNADFERFLWR
jgi:hypothetical protein